MCTAEEMKDLGLVHVLVEPGQGMETARGYIVKSKRRHDGSRAVFEAARAVAPMPLAELDRIVDIWSGACIELHERDLKLMQRLVNAHGLQAAE